MCFHCRGAARFAWADLHPDAAVEVVDADRNDEDDDQRVEQPTGHQCVKRQLEDVKADVFTELRIRYPEGSAIAEQDPFVPVVGHPRDGHQGDQDRHPDPDQAAPGPHELPHPHDQFTVRSGGKFLRRNAIGNQKRRQHADERNHEQQHGREDPSAKQPRPDGTEFDMVKPQIIGVEDRDRP